MVPWSALLNTSTCAKGTGTPSVSTTVPLREKLARAASACCGWTPTGTDHDIAPANSTQRIERRRIVAPERDNPFHQLSARPGSHQCQCQSGPPVIWRTALSVLEHRRQLRTQQWRMLVGQGGDASGSR